MPVGKLPLAVECTGALTASNGDEAVSLTFKTEEGDRYLLPLTVQAAEGVLKVLSQWRRKRDFVDHEVTGS
jgi:hypothetical protein